MKGQMYKLPLTGHKWWRDWSVYSDCLLPGYYCDMAWFFSMMFMWCSFPCVCVWMHCTGGGQQGQEQANEQVEYHWGGNNSLDSSAAQGGRAWNAAGSCDRTLLLPLCWENLVQVHLCGLVSFGLASRRVLWAQISVTLHEIKLQYTEATTEKWNEVKFSKRAKILN